MTETVFVYGTLLTGFGNWSYLLAPQKGISASMEGFKMYDLGHYPGVVKTNEKFPPVLGELFECDEETLGRLDQLEGHPTFYKRELHETTEGKKAWIYLFQTTREHKIVENSSWKE